MEERKCSFCNRKIEAGTGKIYAKKDGTVYYFCSSKCEKNMIGLGRVPRRVEWAIKGW
ncbi:50S ribosomal protein L24e [Methanothrix harundinacea]|jgi:large subunit ribosomal protein L24e|uniref:Large ribosomal subunit protein eL24 n=1 Tax=Methanothrix harundinacea (strain 6Ac) TaxID=1110509 RepID=G7WR07_METH6|nr:50S ribosomal protein L24e [Methanothrix harundinacea]AET65310.1 50S ribosomal protein L24e [Methanothrix harundinacea 6Ac]